MNEFDAKIIELQKNDEFEQVEQLLEEQRKKDPTNIKLLLRLAALEQSIPLSYDRKSIMYLDMAFALDSNNTMALLLLACAQVNYSKGIDDTLKDKLLALQPKDNELHSMIKYMASTFYSGKDEKREEELLQESINLCQSHVWNYVYLAQLYFIQGKNSEADMLIEKALKNVISIYPATGGAWDRTNPNELLNERIKGIYLTADNLENIKHCIKKNATDLDRKILRLSKQLRSERGDRNVIILKIEAILEAHLKKEPDNVDLWIRLAVLEQAIPLVDDYKSIDCLEEALDLDNDNPIALLLTALINYIHLGGVTEELKNQLISLHTNDAEINSMLKYAASWFYESVCNKNANPILEEKLLKESIALYQGHVDNYERLAQLYFKQGRKAEAKQLMQTAQKNIKRVWPSKNRVHDITDFNEFINEHIKGTSTANYDIFRRDLKKVDD